MYFEIDILLLIMLIGFPVLLAFIVGIISGVRLATPRPNPPPRDW